MSTSLHLHLALLCLGMTASALPQLPVNILEPDSDLNLDPRVQWEAPAYYAVDTARDQREVSYDDEVLKTSFKRKAPAFFLQKIPAGYLSTENDTDVDGGAGQKRERRFLLPFLPMLGWAAHELLKHIFAAKEQDITDDS